MTLQIGILLALLCAVTANLGNFLKHRGCGSACAVDIRHPLRTAASLWSQKAFATGMAVGGLAWVLHVAAISVAPLTLVQVVLAGGVVLIAVMADRIFGMRVGPRQWWGLGLMAAGLALLAVTMPAQHGPNDSYSASAMIAFELALLGVGGLLMLGRHAGAPAEHHGVMMAVAAGILFGVCNVAVKAVTGHVGDLGLAGLLTPWLLVAALGSFLAFFASSRAFQDGGAVETIAVTGTATNITVIAGGILVFGDPLPGTTTGIVVQAVAFVLVLVASALTPAPRASMQPQPA
jgi:drug/metabolite transporter (DMT)-like permease